MTTKRKVGKPKIKLFEGLDKIFTKKAKRSNKLLGMKGSTWLKSPPKRIGSPYGLSSKKKKRGD